MSKSYRAVGVIFDKLPHQACDYQVRCCKPQVADELKGVVLATIEQCRAVLADVTKKLNDVDPDARKKHLPDRTIELSLLDLDVSFRARISDGELVDIRECPPGGRKPNIRLVMTSDDLIDMTEGRLRFPHAWAIGRIRLDAGIRDLLRLRALV
jgi:hypothetical protein